jgi:hypothetical protein
VDGLKLVDEQKLVDGLKLVDQAWPVDEMPLIEVLDEAPLDW